MCPECGTAAKIILKRAGEWRIAFYGVFAVMIGFAVFLNRLDPVQESKPSAGDRRPSQVGMAIPWNPAAEHPDPLNAASADNGPYTVRVGFDHPLVVAVPRRNNFVWTVRSTDILLDGKTVYHWDAYLATTSLIDHDVLYREEEKVEADNDDVVGDYIVTRLIMAIDLRDGHQLWESSLTDAPHPHDDPGLCFEVRNGRLVSWADDANGRFAEVKDLQTGKSIGYCFYNQ
jgi:hypothetical protein